MRLVQVAINTGLRVSKMLTIERQEAERAADGWWLRVPAATTQTKGNPKLIPLNGGSGGRARGGRRRGLEWARVLSVEDRLFV